jgi:hypothetical protein
VTTHQVPPTGPVAGATGPATPAPSPAVPDRFAALIRDLAADGVSDGRRVEAVFAAALGRLPTAIEARTLAGQIGRQADKAAALCELLATLVDTPEFRDHAAALQRLAKPPAPGGVSPVAPPTR